MENKIVVSSYRAYSSREQARFIRQEANVLLEKANEFSTTSRRVNRRSAYKVLARSLQKTRGLPFSIRKHQALTELSNYISLAKYNKIVGLEAFNTDLLPVSHPRSTRFNTMTASALAEAHMRWVLDDPRIKDETVKGLLASAMFSPIDSPEHKYSMIRLENMTQGQVPLEVLLAAANPFAGKNSAAARRAREAVQLSDRFERWINMGRSLGKRATDGFRVYVARNDGSTKSLSGELLNQNMFDPNLVDIEVGKGKVATVPTKLGEGLEAFIKSKDSEDGYSPAKADVPNGAQVLPESSIVISDAPSIYRKDEETKSGAVRYTDDKYDIVKFNNPKDAQTAIGEGQKRAAELDKPEPKLLKKGDINPDSGKQFWNPDEPVLAVYRRGKNTPLAFAQSWKDVNNEILRDEPLLDEDEGRTYTRPEPQTADDNVPLLDQADDIFKPTKKKSDKKKKEVSSFPYEVPDRAYEFNPNEEYTPEFEFDDPVAIANDQVPEELEDALLTAVEPVSDNEKATGYAPINFTDGRERDVPAEAIAAAIREQGGDAEMALAQAYDKIAGDNKNEKALLESRGEKEPVVEEAPVEDGELEPSPSDKIIEDEIVKPEPKATTPEPEEAPTEGLEDLEDVSEDTYVPPLLEGLSEEELANFKEDGDYRPFLPKNADIDTPEGLYKLDPNPVDPKENFTPKNLQGEVPPTTALDLSANTVKDLTSELSNAINGTGEHGSGFGEMLTEDPNGEIVNSPVPAEALRDALQLKGKDTDAIIEKINKKAGKAKAKLKPPVSEEPEPETDAKEEEVKPKKGVTYKRSGNRTLLRAGKGGAFKDKEIADFLDENGFEWTGTVEKDGKTLPVNSESATQTDEEFKAFARELRDRFGIDLEPRPATAMSPAQEPIDIDTPAPEPEALIPAPTPEVTPESKEDNWIKQEDGTWVNTSTGEIVEELPEGVTPEEPTVPTPTPEEEIPVVEETPKTEEEKNFIRKAAALLFDQVGKALSAAKADKGLKALEGLTDRQLYDLFGPFNVLKLNELLKRAMESDKESIYGNRKDMISKIMFLKYGAGFKSNETPFMRKSMDEFENSLMRSSTKELEQILDLYYDDMDARVAEKNEEKEKARKLREARARRRQAAEEKLLEKYGEKEESEETPTEETATEQEEITPDNKKVLKELVAERRKLQDAIDEADLSDKVTQEERDALKDALREITRRIDAIVLLSEATKEQTPKEDQEKPDTQEPSIASVFAPNLKAGDVFKDDYFTIVSIETGLTKERDMEIVPATRLTGYYPNSVEQSTKLWADDTEVDVYRGVTPPSKGDLPVLSKPEMKSFSPTGRLQIIGTFKRPNGTIGKKWGLKNPADVERYKAAMDEYKEERKRRMALWTPPEVKTVNNENASAPVAPVEKAAYASTVPASEVQVGDIAFRFDKFGAREFFTVTKVVGTKDGVTTLEGHYVGHQTQTKEWRSGTSIDVIRGEKNLPAAGDKEPLDRPDKTAPRYSELEKERKAKIAEADKGYTFNAEGSIEATPKVSKPRLPAFYGSAELLLDLGDGTNIQEALDARENGYVVFDFETLGNDVQNVLNPDAPIQAAAVRYVGGKKVEELNIYINPEKPLGDYYYETDSEGKKTLRPDRMRDAEGNPITDEWLATQPSIQEQLQKLVDFFGADPILVGQNIGFDLNVLQRWSQKVGIDFELKGSIDTLPIAQALQKIERTTVTFPENPKEGDEALSALGNAWTWNGTSWKAPSNALNQLAERLGVTTDSSDFHNALFDVGVTDQVLRKLLEKLNAGTIPTGGSAAYAEGFKKWVLSLAEEKKKASKREADKIVSDGLAGKPVTGENVDAAVDEVNSVVEEPVTIVEGEESSDSPKEYVSPLYGDKLNEEWVRDPENTNFITNALIKDLKVSDFVFGSDGELYEIIKFEDDEAQPGSAVRIIRANLNTGQILEERQSPREDGGTGFFLKGRIEGGFYRRKDNADKTSAEIETETIEAIPDVDPVVIPEVQPVKGEDVTPEQVATVVNTAIDEIITSKPDASIEEAVKGLNVDETIKEAVTAKPENAEGETGFHISSDGVTLIKPGDKVIHAKTKRTGTVSVLLPSYQGGKYKNYVKVRYDDTNEREPVAAKNLSIVFRPEFVPVVKPKGETTVKDIANKIKDIQGTTPAEGAVNPDELAEKFKSAEKERDDKVKETNFVKTSTSVVSKVKESLPARGTTESSLPSLKTGNLFDVTFAIDKPTEKELKDRGVDLSLDSADDLIVFRATKDLFLRNQPVATIKPDGSIVWRTENDKRSFSLELERVLKDFIDPVTNLNAMIVINEPEDTEGTDADNFGNGTLLGESESSFDYNNISKFPPTEEQKKIVDAIMTGRDVIVQALAGTGKTSTLVLAAKRILAENPAKKLLYIVFNKETAEEAQGRMPQNVDSRTMDNIVYSMLPDNHKERNKLSSVFKINERSLIDYTDYVNLFEYYQYEPVTLSIRGTETTLGRNDLVQEIREAVDRFAISADDVLTEKHFTKKTPFYDTVPPILVEYANRMWKDVSTEEGWDPASKKLSRIDYSHMLKAWALTKPQFIDGLNSGSTSAKQFKDRKNDMFFFDEAQDMNPVIVKLLADQEGIQKVYVGDSNQAIYAFRGAVDELNNVKNAKELYLTQTFRFGAKVAGIGNRFLTLLNSKNKVVGKPGEDDGQIVENMEDPTAIIARSNGGVIDSVFDLLAKGKNPGLNLETYYKAMSYAKSAAWLIAANKGTPAYKKPKLHEDLAGFQNWNEVLKAVQDGKSVGGAMYMVRLLRDRKMTIKELVDKLNSITPIRGTGFRTDAYVPVGKEALADGITGELGTGRTNSGFKGKLTYTIKDGVISFQNSKSYKDFLLKDFVYNPEKFSFEKAFGKEQEEDILNLINDVRRWVQNYPPRIPIDAEIITAHKSKGKEWDRVKLFDDFKQPEINDEGEMQLPDPEELRISYVAATRAKKAIDIGENLKWIYDVTSEDDEKPQLTDVEKLSGMTVTPDPEPVTPEEVGNEVVKARKITDQKTLEVANRLIELIEKGVVPWTKGWSGGGFLPTNGKTNKSYQGTNTLALWAAMHLNDWTDPRFLTFNQGKSLGGYVRKGETGIKILKPNVVTKDVKQPDGTIKKEGYIYFTEIPVFNVSQFEKLNLPPLVKKDPVPVLEIETQILESYKDHPEIIYRPQDGAFYRPSEDKIYLPLREQFDSSQTFIETLFHELGHSTGHTSRLGKEGKRKDLQDNYGDHRASRGEEELIAEITVALIAAEFGVEIDWGNTASYAEGWLKPLKDDPGMIIIAAKQAQDAVNWMLGIKKGDAPENSPEAGSEEQAAMYDSAYAEKGFKPSENPPNRKDGTTPVLYSTSTGEYVETEYGLPENSESDSGITVDEYRALSSYQGSGHLDINSYLRKDRNISEDEISGTTKSKDQLDIKIGILDSLILKMPEVKSETPLYRIFDSTEVSNLSVGQVYVDKAFTSASFVDITDPKNSKILEELKFTPNSRDTEIVIGRILPNGNYSGVSVNSIITPNQFYGNEKEFLMPRNTVLRYLGSSKTSDGKTVMDFERTDGKNLGSEGQTGEQIAEEEPVTPEVAPEPNVGEQGQTGEEIAKNLPKNKDASIQPTKLTVNDEEYDLWDDITYDRTSEAGKDNDNLESAHGIFASRLLDGQKKITDRNEIGKYIADILKKYGYGNKLFYLAGGSVANKMLGDDPSWEGSDGTPYGGGIEAGIGLANSEAFADGDPLKGVEFPVVLVRKRGISKVALLHEIAHLMEGGWKSNTGGGHNQAWHQTLLTLLRQEGFQKEANLLALTIGEVKGDTGVINP